MSSFELDTTYSAITGEHIGGLYIPTVEHSDTSDVLIDGVGLADGPGPLGDWHALTGHTAQHGYRGAVMHPSETMSDDSIREAVREAGGDVFAIVAVEIEQCDAFITHGACDCDNACPAAPAGWAVIYRAAVRDDVRAAHTRSDNGFCRCGLTPTLTPAQHECHLREIS